MNGILYDGKSKTLYNSDDENSYIMKFKDTATAFDGKKKGELEGKGKLNAAISNIIYDYLAKNGIKTHIIKILDEESILVKKTEIILVEVIVRNIAAGSFSKKYGIEEGILLKNASVEFSLKSDELGDPMINESQITAIGIASKEELDYLSEQALKINSLLCGLFEKAGIRLVDFKLEFGRSASEGEIILSDEISPDSCRLWDIDTNKKLDKDRFRRDMGNVLDGYRDVLRRLENVGQI